MSSCISSIFRNEVSLCATLLQFLFVLKFCDCLKPNFVFILTDDQDNILGGMTPLAQSKHLIGDNGITFSNMFVTTPLCCPSRASILTGKYAHNHGVVNNSISGNCNSYSWQASHEQKTFITNLKKNGYATFYAGKYLNQYGKSAAGGVHHVPPGWENWIGLVGNSCYYNYTLSVNGIPEKHGNDPQKDYLTDVIMEKAMRFLENQSETPFFMFLAPPAPHSPFTPSPKFKNAFRNFSAPRTPNFNFKAGKDKHWLLRQPPSPLPTDVIRDIDETFRNRWRTLLSVDEGVENIFQVLKKKKMLRNTYVFLMSDNGFHLGQFSLPWDKRQPYEFDIRVPLLVRGPGIKPKTKVKESVLNIDIAPTILALANLTSNENFDGKSLLPLLFGSDTSSRTEFIIEHQGESSSRPIPGCPQYQPQEVDTCEVDCICEDSRNNTYICLRELSVERNFVTCYFKDDENFVEAYNLTEDPYQMKNLYCSQENSPFFYPKLKN
ncbi:N-acetylglucosamine-6-sulfatase-like [Uloborus diversus]|uniref:N-acetylglucosamine-6-sulfatase-like n=1 Tax=Uloborus diversus TaxID=327109 RepID=UPI002409C9C4|nr:N-acetylglucosamine-6-sulfatase-like [Uloborus diversus]